MQNWIILLLPLIFGSQPVGQQVEQSVEATKDTLNKRTTEQRKSFENAVRIRRSEFNDKMNRIGLDSFYTSVASTTVFLDSAASVLDKLDPNEIQYVRDHLMGNLGDSIYQKVKDVMNASAALAKKPKQKAAIDSIYSNLFSEPDLRGWKNGYFGNTSAFGASMVIHGLGIEVLTAAQISLEE